MTWANREAPPPSGQHDWSVHAEGLGIAYCRRCARPDLAAYKRRGCVPLPPDVAEARIARQLKMLGRLKRGGGQG
jgi:hypothetical protein